MGYSVHSDGVLSFGTRMCIPNDTKLRQKIIKETHNTRFAMHHGSTKNVLEFTKVLLVEGNEMGYCRVYVKMFNVSTSECRTSEAWG